MKRLTISLTITEVETGNLIIKVMGDEKLYIPISNVVIIIYYLLINCHNYNEQ